MNRIYKLIWNPQLRAMVVASELVSGQGRASKASQPLAPRFGVLSVACGLALMATASMAHAQSAELADLQNLVARYSQPVEDLSALVARASGQPVAAAATTASVQVGVSSPAIASIAGNGQLSSVARPLAPVIRKVRHAGLSVTPAAQVQTVASALANASVAPAGLQPADSGIPATLTAVAESLSATGTGQAGAPAGRLVAALRPRDPALGNRSNRVLGGVSTAVGLVEDGTGKLLDKTHLGSAASGLLNGVGSLIGGVGEVAGAVVGGLTGSQALAGTVTGLTGALDDGLGAVGENLDDTNLAGVVGALGGTVHNAGSALVGGVSSTVGGVGGSNTGLVGLNGTTGALTAGLGNGLTQAVGQLTGNPAPSSLQLSAPLSSPVAPSALQPDDPRRVTGGSRTSGLIVGTGGATGTLGSLLGPTLQDLLGGDGYIRNGDTTISSANVVQAYAVTEVLGLPVVNLSPVGTLLDGLGGVTTGSNSHLTVLGGATSDSYIYNINNGDPNGLLGLVLPSDAPDWADSCLNVLGLVSTDCWAVNAAQDYQVLIGDGAYANGSKEVVIGTNARHQLPQADANDVFVGNGVNDPTNPSGVPTADYDARLGHSVVIGDSAVGTANGQTLLGAGAISDKANSVALGFKSNAERGGQDNYTAYGLAAAQTSIGEVAVGSAGRERQITHVAAGSGDTDAVNVAQLRSAIDTVSVGSNPYAVLYADNGAGLPDYSRIELGDGATSTTISNLAAGEISDTSTEAVNGAQLFATADTLATHLGGGAALQADGSVTAPTYTLSNIAADGSVSSADYNDVGSAFDAVDQSMVNINTRVDEGQARALKYDLDAAGAINYNRATLGDGNARTLLTNLADGLVEAGSSDAITGGQLHGNASSVAAVIGAGAAVDTDGNLSAPTFTLTSIASDGSRNTADYNDVGSAFDAVDQSINNISNDFNNQISGAVRYDLDATGNVDYTQVTFGDGTGAAATRLTNVAAGTVNAASTDAITGGQLHGNASSVAAVIGAGAAVDTDGNLSAPTFTLTSIASDGSRNTADYNDVGSAFDAVDQSITNISTSIDNQISGTVRYDLDAAGNVDYTQVTFGDGTGAAATRLTNVAAGTVGAGSSDAITGAQLYANADSLATHLGAGAGVAADGTVTAPDYQLFSVDASGNLVSSTHADVGSAFDAVGQSIRNIFNNGTGYNDPLAVRYLADSAGNATNVLALTGSGSGAVSITNLAAGSVAAGSLDAVNGSQLAGTNVALVDYLGGTTSFDSNSNVWVGPTFALATVNADGTLSTTTFNDVTSAFNSVSQSLTNISNLPPGTPSTTTSPYLDVNSTGAPAVATGAEAIALGSAASSDGQAAVAIGQGASAAAANSVALGAGSVADRADTVSIGAAGSERQLTHVADGSLATDAVNVRQLQASQQGSVRYDQNTDGSTNYNSITLGRSSTGPALVRNVAAGVSSTDAVNVGQMQAGLDQVRDWSRNYTDDRFNAVGRDLRDIDNRASAGIASAMAMAGLPQPYEAGRSMASFAASSFNGEGSMAVGISGISEGGRWIYKLSGSANTRGDAGVTVGAGIQW